MGENRLLLSVSGEYPQYTPIPKHLIEGVKEGIIARMKAYGFRNIMVPENSLDDSVSST